MGPPRRRRDTASRRGGVRPLLAAAAAGTVLYSLVAAVLLVSTQPLGQQGMGDWLSGFSDQSTAAVEGRHLLADLNQQWWAFLVIPLMSGVVGFITNVVAVQMTFYPIKMWPLDLWAPKGSPVGILGWQGIIPAKADKMVSGFKRLLRGVG